MTIEPQRVGGQDAGQERDALFRAALGQQGGGLAQQDAPVARGERGSGGEQVSGGQAGFERGARVGMGDQAVPGGERRCGAEGFVGGEAIPAGAGGETEQLLGLRTIRVARGKLARVGQEEFGKIRVDEGKSRTQRGSRVGQRELRNPGEGFGVLQGCWFPETKMAGLSARHLVSNGSDA